jgi:hypothetical protein
MLMYLANFEMNSIVVYYSTETVSMINVTSEAKNGIYLVPVSSTPASLFPK